MSESVTAAVYRVKHELTHQIYLVDMLQAIHVGFVACDVCFNAFQHLELGLK